MCAHWGKEEWVLGFLHFWAESCYTFFLACVTIRTNFLKCFAIRGMGNALQPQISVINMVSNLIWVRSRIRRQVRLTRKNCYFTYFLTNYIKGKLTVIINNSPTTICIMARTLTNTAIFNHRTKTCSSEVRRLSYNQSPSTKNDNIPSGNPILGCTAVTLRDRHFEPQPCSTLQA